MNIFKGLHAFIWQDYTENNCNTYLTDASKEILIDPGHAHLFDHVKNGMAALNISLDQIDVVIATHGHPDHLEAVRSFDKPTLFAMNMEEYQFISELAGDSVKIPRPDFFLKEGDLIIGDERFEVISTPGHSPGSICLYWRDKKALFTGDVIFNQGIGRTDLPGGDGSLLKESINRIKTLDVEYLLTGHGNIVEGREAIKANFQNIENYWFNYL